MAKKRKLKRDGLLWWAWSRMEEWLLVYAEGFEYRRKEGGVYYRERLPSGRWSSLKWLFDFEFHGWRNRFRGTNTRFYLTEEESKGQQNV